MTSTHELLNLPPTSSSPCVSAPEPALTSSPLSQAATAPKTIHETPSDRPDVYRLSPLDLTLLAHWCSTTYQCLSPKDDKNRNIWRSIVVRDGMKHPALLEGILALSALEVIHECAETATQPQKYRPAAHIYWDRARHGLDTQVAASTSIKPRSRNALFSLCNILMVLAFGHAQLKHSTRPAQKSHLSDMCQILRQMRGSPEILVDLTDQVQKGELAGLFHQEKTGPVMPNTFTLAILTLRKAALDDKDGEPAAKLICDQSIDHLTSCLRYVGWSSYPGLVGFVWILKIPTGFVDLVESKHPLALMILAHYCVVLHHLRVHWWMRDFGIKVLRDICWILGRDRLDTISWALDSTGLSLAEVFS